MPVGVRWGGQVGEQSNIQWVTQFSMMKRDDLTLTVSNNSAGGVASDMVEQYNAIADRNADAQLEQDGVTVALVPIDATVAVTGMLVDGVEVTEAGVAVGSTGLTATKIPNVEPSL